MPRPITRALLREFARLVLDVAQELTGVKETEQTRHRITQKALQRYFQRRGAEAKRAH